MAHRNSLRGTDHSESFCDPMDINSPDFNPDLFMNELMREKNLSQLMEREQHSYREIQSLDSDMQTLVYENYNKFISATDTIRDMSSNFDLMEKELATLSDNMAKITASTTQVQSSLRSTREELKKLSSTNNLLQKLHFIFELCPKMTSLMAKGSYHDAVRYYLEAEKELEQYRHFASISAIDHECKQLLIELKDKLYQSLDDIDLSTQTMNDTISMLLQLNGSPEFLCEKFFAFARNKLELNLSELEYYLRENLKNIQNESSDDAPMDILEYTDLACNGYWNNFQQFIASFQSLFAPDANNIPPAILFHLRHYIGLNDQFFKYVTDRWKQEKPYLSDPRLFLLSLDRFYTRISALKVPKYVDSNFAVAAKMIILASLQLLCDAALTHLKSSFTEEIDRIKGLIVSSNSRGANKSIDPVNSPSNFVFLIERNINDGIRTVISNLIVFLYTDVFFMKHLNFENVFLTIIRENIVIGFIEFILSQAESLHELGSHWDGPSLLVLIFSRICFDLDSNVLPSIISFTDTNLRIKDTAGLTATSDLCLKSKESAQNLLNFYVRREGFNISQMIRKSMETRDWLVSTEPRTVRSVMKMIVDEITLIDSLVGDVYEEGSRAEHSSDSSRSRRTYSLIAGSGRHNRGVAPWNASIRSGPIDQSLLSNIQKLFSEKLEIFSSIDFSKLSIVTGIIKITLKSFVECVRLCTFNKFGLQQVQVDSFYLQLFLWKFVTDESLIHSLLDEVISSATVRSLDPVLMEISVIEKICEEFTRSSASRT